MRIWDPDHRPPTPPADRPHRRGERLAVDPAGRWLASAGETRRCGSGIPTPAANATADPPRRRVSGVGGGPGRPVAGLRRRRRDGADLGSGHRRQRHRLTGHSDRVSAGGGPGRAAGWPPPAATTRCGSGMPTPAPNATADRPHRPGGGAGGGPGRPVAGLRRPDATVRIWDRSSHRAPQPPAEGPHRPGVARWRWTRPAAGWPPPARRDGADLGCDTGAERHRLDGHTGLVSALAVDPAGGWLASAGDDQTVRIWDRRHRQPNATG